MESHVLAPQIKKLSRFNQDVKWFQNNYEQLQRKYEGKFVAVKNKRVIGTDQDAERLIRKVRRKHGNTSSILVEEVGGRSVEYLLYTGEPEGKEVSTRELKRAQENRNQILYINAMWDKVPPEQRNEDSKKILKKLDEKMRKAKD